METLVQTAVHQLERDGYTLLRGIFSQQSVAKFADWIAAPPDGEDPALLSSRGSLYGARDLLRVYPQVAEIVREPALRTFVAQVLGGSWGLVRGLYFDKPPERSWSLPWHRDETIALAQHVAGVPGYSNPTIKAGVPHMIAPYELLQRMLTLRIHLDPMTAENGPLLVMRGSHRDPLGQADSGQSIDEIHCHSGDVFVMRPLLSHSSVLSKAGNLLHRRIIHLELTSQRNLPGGLQWREFIEP